MAQYMAEILGVQNLNKYYSVVVIFVVIFKWTSLFAKSLFRVVRLYMMFIIKCI